MRPLRSTSPRAGNPKDDWTAGHDSNVRPKALPTELPDDEVPSLRLSRLNLLRACGGRLGKQRWRSRTSNVPPRTGCPASRWRMRCPSASRRRVPHPCTKVSEARAPRWPRGHQDRRCSRRRAEDEKRPAGPCIPAGQHPRSCQAQAPQEANRPVAGTRKDRARCPGQRAGRHHVPRRGRCRGGVRLGSRSGLAVGRDPALEVARDGHGFALRLVVTAAAPASRTASARSEAARSRRAQS